MTVPKVAAVIGPGTKGPGMAAVLAHAGSEVSLDDISDDVIEHAKGSYQIAADTLDRVEAASAPGRSATFELDLGKALTGAELVLEAVLEKLELKREVTAELEGSVLAEIAPTVAFLASEEAHWITGQMLSAVGGHTRH